MSDLPIRRWHVSLVSDLKVGKSVGIEAAAAIENLEDQLFAAETALLAATGAKTLSESHEAIVRIRAAPSQ